VSNRLTAYRRQGYRAVAVAVLESAMRDLSRGPTTNGTARPRSLYHETALQFFTLPPSPCLTLWCEHLDLAPDRVCHAVIAASK
jgi:hypothetical protein